MQELLGFAPRLKPSAATDPLLLRGWVFVVEDEYAVRMLLCILLRQLGYPVLEASDTSEALRVWAQHQASIRLLLTDLALPDGNGLQLIERFRQDRPDLPALVCTGYDQSAVSDLPIGPKLAFLAKPFDPRSLAEAVHKQWQPLLAETPQNVVEAFPVECHAGRPIKRTA